jgi:cytosine/adenosine deaminase-related metal-dependent hydrolase
MSTIAIFGSYVQSRRDGAQHVLRDRWVLLAGNRIAAVTPDRPSAAEIHDRPGRFILPGLLNLHNHCFSEAVARSHTEDGNGRRNNQSIVYTVLLPLTRRGAALLSSEERLAVARLGILQLLKGGATTVMEPFRNSIPEMFDAAEEMGIRFYGAPYLFSTSDAKAGPDGVVHYAGDDGAADLATWNALYRRWNGRGEGRLRLAMSPHATDTCGPDLLRACAARARELDVPITTHLAQSRAEVETIGKRHDGRTPAEYLDWLGLLAPDRCRSQADGGTGCRGVELPTRVRACRHYRRLQPLCRARCQDGGRHRWLQHGPARRTQRRFDDLEDYRTARRCRQLARPDRSGHRDRGRPHQASRSRNDRTRCDG